MGQLFQIVEIAILAALHPEDAAEDLHRLRGVLPLQQKAVQVLRLRIGRALGRHALEELLGLVVLAAAITEQRDVIVDLGKHFRRQAAELIVVGLVQDVRTEHFVVVLLGDRDRALDRLVIVRMRGAGLDDLAIIEE